MPHTNSSQSRILIIDDSTDIHRLLSMRLKDQRAEILGAMSGAEGVELARQRLPDLILLDIDMPGLGGFETLQALKNDPATVQIPVIFLSGSQHTEDKVRGFELGAVDYVTKPFEVAELRARVRSALRTQQLLKMLAQLAQIDGLTGLWNRKYFDNRIGEGIAISLRHNMDFCVVLCDVDKFKNLNDSYGHPFGDQVLQEFARLLQSNCRESDVPCRYGGEEFAILLPATGVADGLRHAERIRSALESTTWPGRPGLIVTASFGVTSLSQVRDAAAASLIAAADRALYEAKHAGRNRVVCDRSNALARSA